MSDNSSQPVYIAPSPLTSLGCAQLWGALIMCIAYGVVVTLCLQCSAMFIKGFRAGRSTSLWDRLLIIYVFLMFVVSTIYTGTSMQLIVLSFVDNPNLPGPPPTETAVILNSASDSSLAVSAFLSDALLLWRCTVVYKSSFVPDWFTLLVAAIIWLTEFILGIFFLVEVTATSPAFGGFEFVTPFWGFSLALNVLVTVVIVGRITFFRRRLAGVLGHGHLSQYTGAIAMIVESAVLYSIFLILFIVPYILGSPLQNVFCQAPSLVQAVSALMIVYRVTQGKAWMSDTRAQMDTLSQSSRSRPIQLSNMSTLQAGGSSTFVGDAEKGSCSGIRITQDVCSSGDSGSI